MFETLWYESLRDRLKRADKAEELSSDERVLLLKVELGLRLLEIINWPQEPVQSAWEWFTNLPLPDARRQRLTVDQLQAIANTPVLLRLGRLEWLSALKVYSKLAAKWRCYLIDPANLTLSVTREPNGPTVVTDRIQKYDELLFRTVMPYRLRQMKYAPAGTVYFRTTRKRPRTLMGNIDRAMIDAATARSLIRFSDQTQEKLPVSLTVAELRRIAQELDQREGDRRYEPKGNWLSLVNTIICYRLVQDDGSLGATNSEPLDINGFLHLAGMVGSGKSTLMKLIAAFGALFGGWRTTLIVGETLAAINLADYFNQVLADPQTRVPVAVPLLGRTNRHVHLLKLHSSETFGPNHYGPRWLDTRCFIQGTVRPTDLQEGPLLPGDEPCERLYENEEDMREYDKRCACPLFSVCPAQQLYRDMPGALIWIATPGAMAMSRLPVQMETRNMRLGEIIYHESRLVVFDEVEMIQQWFDNVYATDQRLLDTSGGALDIIDQVTSEGIVRGYDISEHTQRWITSVRRAREIGLQVCTLLQRHSFLTLWVGGRYFTAYRLFASLAQRLAGIDAGKGGATPDQERIGQELLEYFNTFHDDDIMPPLGQAVIASPGNSSSPVALLHTIADAILARTGSFVDARTVERCKAWIEECVPDVKNTLALLELQVQAWEKTLPVKRKQFRPARKERPDDVNTLALRLELAIAASILERVVRIVFDEWYSAPLFITSKVQSDQRLQRVPRDLVGVLPTAPTGSLFGFLYISETEQPDDAAPGEELPARERRLSVFQYHSIGRWYVLHFHRLLANVGYPGPHVLAMSGTSWLPDSAAWHLNVRPKAVLEPAAQSQNAISDSQFRFLPQYDEDGNPIVVSGSEELEESVWLLAKELAGTPSRQACPLQADLTWLDNEGKQKPEWRGRQRLLLFVNSYDQVKRVVEAIVRVQRDWEEVIYGVVRSKNERQEDRWVSAKKMLGHRHLHRGDIESFARITEGKILVAPLQAIGRGYNILNEENIAAFGSVYFLTRPMPLPYDMVARAKWMNRETLDWCDDPNLKCWQTSLYSEKGENLRKKAHDEWDMYEGGASGAYRGYRYLPQNRKDDLAASMAGLIIQACGRLLRGGVPFRAFFVDAAWAPRSADTSCTEPDTAVESLLVGMIQILERYCQKDPVARSLYQPLVTALKRIQGLRLS